MGEKRLKNKSMEQKTNMCIQENSGKIEEVLKIEQMDFPGGSVCKNPPANAGSMGLIPGPGGFHKLWANWAHVPQLREGCTP